MYAGAYLLLQELDYVLELDPTECILEGHRTQPIRSAMIVSMMMVYTDFCYNAM